MPKGKTHVEHHGIYHHAGWPKDTFWTWFAGFFDGEGSIRTTADGVELSVSSITRDVIESIHRYIGIGYIELISYNSDRWNDKYTLRIRRFADVRRVLISIRPHLTIKVEACDKDFLRIAKAEARVAANRDRQAAMIRLAAEGLTHEEIAAKVGRSRTAVSVTLSAAADRGLSADDVETGQEAPLFVRDMKKYTQRRNSSPNPGPTTRTRLTPK